MGLVLAGTLLVVVAFAIQINYDNQFMVFLFGPAAPAPRGQFPGAGINQGDLSQRFAAGGFSAAIYVRLSSYLIGAAGVMTILVGSSIPAKKAGEVS